MNPVIFMLMLQSYINACNTCNVCIYMWRNLFRSVCTCYVEFITGLLNNVGTHIDPTRLIEVYTRNIIV